MKIRIGGNCWFTGFFFFCLDYLSLFLLKEKVTIPIFIGTRKTRSAPRVFPCLRSAKAYAWNFRSFYRGIITGVICKKKFPNQNLRFVFLLLMAAMFLLRISIECTSAIG